MLPVRRLLRKRAIFAFVDGFLLLLALLFLIVNGTFISPTRSIFYPTAPGQILVQLAELPEHAEGETRMTPEWTLYGDGTLLFQADPHDDLWRAHLSSEAIQRVLDVIVNRDQFFSSSARLYGNSNIGDEQLLTVDVNGQRKAVTLTGSPTMSNTSNNQTTHVFAIEHFLLAYHPASAVWYAPDPDPDDNNGS